MAAPHKTVSVEEVRTALDYDSQTGRFVWRYRSDVPAWWNTRYAGREAGSVIERGYRAIVLNRRLYLEHRLVWLLETGEQPFR